MVRNDPSTIRDTLFGDMPFPSWPGPETDADAHPWRLFATARRYLNEAKPDAAIASLQEVIAAPDLESRHYLQAWTFLRSLGVAPGSSMAGRVYGVVVEVGLEEGLDVVAGYADHSACYLNHSGAMIIWDAREDAMDAHIDRLLVAGNTIIENTGPWDDPRPPAPEMGRARINVLTPSGLHFGDGPIELLATDPIGAEAIQAAMGLMKALASLT